MAESNSTRIKQSTASNFKAHCHTEKGRREINAFLNGLLKVKESLDEQKKSWCWWLLAGGKTVEEFKCTVRSYNHPTICGLVWNKNFVAYRCRDCGISPCMSICADCFHAGNHEGHDFNMFKSQAGGACDCGDESVMSRDGFCSRHGKEVDESAKRKPPHELFDMVRIVVPQLCMRLYMQLDQVDKEALGASSDVMTDANELAEFLMSICETDTMKNVVAECLLVKKSNIEAATKDRHLMTSSSTASTSSRRVNILTKTFHRVERKDSFSMECDASESAEDEEETFLDCMMDFVTKLEFPQKIVTFLLHLLPCTQYKESFTRVFCQNYQKIAKILVSTTDTGPNVEQLASRVVHVSVQLYSNKQLAEKMVKEQNFLQVMVRVLHDMIKPALESFKRGQEITSQLVVNCDNRALKDHCYWPIVTDFINVLSHKTIAETFMTDHDLVRQWVTFIQYLTGMNISRRQLITHVEFEPTAYCTSFSVELEAASSPLWSMINACTILNSEACVRNMIQSIVNALESWYQHGSAIMPKRDEVTFHLPLHRYLSGFLSLAMSHFNLTVDVPQTVLAQMIQHLLQIQAAVCEINAGRWVRNGNQIRSQVRLYVECHFCNSMVDLDIFLLQLCAANLDPDDFLNTILERFGIKHWFRFGALAVPTPSCFDSDSDISMVKGALTLILTLLNSRLYLGQSNQDVIRQEMVTQLCIGDKTHSQLVELIPDKPGQSHKIQDFEKTLNELADYKAPSFESGLMQQGKYAPKDKVWESEFDPIHVFHRVVQRQDIQSAMSRYSAYINKNNQSSNTLWPPFKPLKPLPKGFEGVLRLLNCKTMHGMLYYIFHQVTMDNSSIPDAVLYLAVHLTSMSIENTTPLPRAPSMVVQSRVEKDIGCQIAMRCIDHLEMYGKHVKGLHQTEDLRHINADLVSKLQKDPTAPIDPQHFSCHEVCVVMACSLHHIMQPPLFDPFLPFMARVLNSALTNRSNTHEKVAQLQHIQFLLELLPQHRQTLVRKLTKHLLSVSERYKIPTKNLVLVSDDTQPMELSMLLMYLIKYHDWLFRVRTPKPGWPCTIADLDFTSLSMVNNIRHTVGIVTDQSVPMDTSDKETGSSLSSSQPSLKPSIEGDANGSVDFQRLVQEFMAITEASESVARNLLYTCKGNLEVAINIHLNMEDTIPDVIPCPDSAQSTSTTGEGSEEIASVQQPVAINESILSLLLKIKTNLQSSSSSNTPSFGTGIYYINKVFELASKHSVENSSILSAIDSPQTDPSTSSPGDDADNPAAKTSLRRQRARERQQKLLAEFASKQKTFMERALKKDPDALDMSMDVDGTVPDIQATSYECVICGESSPSTEERPVGLVALLQPSAVLKHRSLKPQHNSSGSDPVRELQCGTFVKSRMNAFSQHFSKDDSLDTLAAGCNGGIHVQTCGHYLHVDCQQSYLRSLQEEEAAQLHQMHSFNPRNGDFTCPLCRQLGNCVLPEIPSRISTTREESRPVGYAKCLNLHEEVLRKYNQNCMTKLTKSALNFSVLGASIKTVTEIVSMLESSSDDIKSDKRFSFIYRTLRTNLELEHVDRTARKLSAPKKSCFGSIFRAFQFHCQTIVAPMIRIWSELSNIEIPENTSTTANKATGVPVLLRDGPSLLIQMMLSWPTAISLQDFQCFVQVVYNLVFTQALVHSCCKFVGDERLSWQETGKKATLQEKSPKKSPKPLTVDLLLGFVTQVLSSSNLFKEDNQLLGISQSVWSPHMVEQSIRDFCLPYLKLCSLISSLCFDTALPTVEAADQEFQAYAASLGMYSEPGSSREAFSCADCLRWQDNERPLSVIRKWCDLLSSLTRRYEIFSKSEDLIPVTYHWPPPSLIALPERYDTLIQHYRKQKCSKCGTKPDDPAICLVCGQFVCLQGTCCMATQDDVRRYECIQHAVDCGAGTGVFLIVLSSVTIVIRADRVCIWGSVYLDSFGEEDRDLRRGKPLFLSQDRFKRLEEQWFTHSFDHTCKRWKRHLNTL